MGEISPPTTADYAYHNSSQALDKAAELAVKIEKLETLLAEYGKQLRILEGKFASLAYGNSTRIKGM